MEYQNPRLSLLGLFSRFGGVLASGLAFALTGAADAQPVQPVPAASTPVGDILATSPSITIGNGLIKARVAPPGPHAFYQGTRFDQAGVITGLKLNGQEFYGPWFDRTAPDVLDYTYDTAGAVVAGPDSATIGPVEEFGPLDFAPRPSLFVKIGVGVLRQPDSQPYDHYRHYQVVDSGRRTTQIGKDSVTFTQTLSNGGTAYLYEKILRLMHGKPQLIIEHRLKNTGIKPITTTVYDHNFLTIGRRNAGVRITFPFTVSAANAPAADLIKIQGSTLTYLRPMALKERVSFPITGFGSTPKDYDFSVEDTATGSAVRVEGDKSIDRINIFSIDKVQSVEPYLKITIEPGQEERWSYRYTFTTH
jgi:outer membrane lipoprotein-sorting protein